MADGVFDHLYNSDKNETYEVADAQARSDISVLEGDVSALDSGKVDKVTGKGLSTNDYTTEEKIKLQGIEDNAEVANVWFCVVDEAHVNANNSHIIDIYAHTVGRRLRRLTAPRFDAGDMLRVYFNGIDVDNILPVSVNVAYRLVINEAYESGVEPSEPYGMGYDRYFFSPYSQRDFTFIQSGNYLVLDFVYTQATEDMHGEISVTSSLTSNATEVAASAYAVKRLKDLIDSISGGSLTYEVVQTLPVSDISTTTIYLVPKQTAGTQNVYDEYINPTGVPSGWEKLGDTEIDLTNYYTKSETDTLLDDKADTADLATVATTGSYNDLLNKPSIPSGQIQSDWNQTNTSEVDYIKNKPTIPAAQVNSDWNASSGVAQILNKPTIPTNTWRPIELNDVQIASSSPVRPLNIIAGDAISITHATGQQDENITISSFQPDYYGYNDSFDDVTGLASGGTWQPLASFNRANGIWLLSVAIQYPANSTGFRGIGINASGATNPTDVTGIRYQQTVQAANGAATNLVLTIPVTLSTPRTIYIMGRQNSGSAMGTSASPIRVRASWIRIAPLG